MGFIKINNEMTVNCTCLLIAAEQIISIEASEDYTRIWVSKGTFYDVGCLAQDVAEAVIAAKRSNEIVTVSDWTE